MEGRAQPKGNSRQLAAVRTQRRVAASIRVAVVRRAIESVHRAHRPTFDLREEPGALVAHAGICTGCALQAHEIQSSEMATLIKLSQQSGTESCVVLW